MRAVQVAIRNIGLCSASAIALSIASPGFAATAPDAAPGGAESTPVNGSVTVTISGAATVTISGLTAKPVAITSKGSGKTTITISAASAAPAVTPAVNVGAGGAGGGGADPPPPGDDGKQALGNTPTAKPTAYSTPYYKGGTIRLRQTLTGFTDSGATADDKSKSSFCAPRYSVGDIVSLPPGKSSSDYQVIFRELPASDTIDPNCSPKATHVKIGEPYDIPSTSLDESLHDRYGWAAGAFAVPFKYYVAKHAFETNATAGLYLGYQNVGAGLAALWKHWAHRHDAGSSSGYEGDSGGASSSSGYEGDSSFVQDRFFNGLEITPMVGGGVATLGGGSFQTTPGSDATKSTVAGYSIATGLLFTLSQDSNFSAGLLTGWDFAPDNGSATNKFIYQSNIWLAAAINYKLNN